MKVTKLLLYCTKAKPYIRKDNKHIFWTYTNKQLDFPNTILNGKIVAECDFEVEEITLKFDDYEVWIESNTDENVILKQSCLDDAELYNYLGGRNGDRGYAIHINNLHIFDEPRELYEYVKYNQNDEIVKLNKAPNNMMFVYECIGVPMYDECHFCGYDEIWNDYIIISVSSQEMCRIANKEQTVLVRRNVLKEMK